MTATVCIHKSLITLTNLRRLDSHYTEIGSRLDSAWIGDPGQRRIYTDAQDCAARFRNFCLQNNLLDFSLQLEVFWDYLWTAPLVHDYLIKTYHHLIYDNIEEDVPRAHDLIREWLPQFDSALLIYDEGAGYRRFLGADVDTAYALHELCDDQVTFDRIICCVRRDCAFSEFTN